MTHAALVTGSSGFIGFHLCRRLLADGFRVVSYVIVVSLLWRFWQASNTSHDTPPSQIPSPRFMHSSDIHQTAALSDGTVRRLQHGPRKCHTPPHPRDILGQMTRNNSQNGDLAGVGCFHQDPASFSAPKPS